MSTRIITDNPEWTGKLDGYKAVEKGNRNSRADQVPENQRSAYSNGFRRGARDASKLEDED